MAYFVLSPNGEESLNKFLNPDPDPIGIILGRTEPRAPKADIVHEGFNQSKIAYSLCMG